MRRRFLAVVSLHYPWGEIAPQAHGTFRFFWLARLWARVTGSVLNRGLIREGREAQAEVRARIREIDLDNLPQEPS